MLRSPAPFRISRLAGSFKFGKSAGCIIATNASLPNRNSDWSSAVARAICPALMPLAALWPYEVSLVDFVILGNRIFNEWQWCDFCPEISKSSFGEAHECNPSASDLRTRSDPQRHMQQNGRICSIRHAIKRLRYGIVLRKPDTTIRAGLLLLRCPLFARASR